MICDYIPVKTQVVLASPSSNSVKKNPINHFWYPIIDLVTNKNCQHYTVLMSSQAEKAELFTR